MSGALGTQLCGVSVVALTVGTGGDKNADVGETDVVSGGHMSNAVSNYVSLGQGETLKLQIAAPGISSHGTFASDLFVF